MPLYSYKCSECGYQTTEFRTVAGRNDFPDCLFCESEYPTLMNPGVVMERDFAADHGSPRNASTGEMISKNAGIGPTQVAEGNAALQAAGRDAHYDERGTLFCKDRREFNKVLRDRGLFNKDEIISPRNV
jgi:putative FmdB family regulatory protein